MLAEGSRTNSVFTAPASIADGDWLFLTIFIYNGTNTPPTPTPPSGFSTVSAGSPTWPYRNTLADTTQADTWCWVKKASGESGNYTVTHTGPVTTRGSIIRVTGADPSTPIDKFTQNKG